MEEEFSFTGHAIRRIRERSGLTPDQILERLKLNVGVVVGERRGKGNKQPLRISVLWDTPRDAPLLIIQKKMFPMIWEVVTVYEPLEYGITAGLLVEGKHIHGAYLREIGFTQNGTPEKVDNLARLQLVVRFEEEGRPKTKRHKIGSVPIAEYYSTFDGDAKKITSHFIRSGKADALTIPADSVVEAEVIGLVKGEAKVLSSWVVM
jgi:hypothetical protein